MIYSHKHRLFLMIHYEYILPTDQICVNMEAIMPLALLHSSSPSILGSLKPTKQSFCWLRYGTSQLRIWFFSYSSVQNRQHFFPLGRESAHISPYHCCSHFMLQVCARDTPYIVSLLIFSYSFTLVYDQEHRNLLPSKGTTFLFPVYPGEGA